MADSQSQTELTEEEMSFEERNPQPRAHHQTFRQVGGGFAFPRSRLVIPSLGLVNAALLIAAVVIGIYCAKTSDQIPHSAAIPLLVEVKYLSNHTDINKARLEAEAALAKERTSYMHMKLQLKQQKRLIDVLQRESRTLVAERITLQNNKTNLEESCNRCRLGWTFLKSSCYFFSYSTALVNPKKNWTDSRADCISRGGDMLVINNLAEQLFISDNIPRVISGSGAWYQNGFWIGLTDTGKNGTWVWVNNVTEVETMYWKSGQPSHDEAHSGHCAALLYYDDRRRTWYSGNCKDLLMYWICEAEPSQT